MKMLRKQIFDCPERVLSGKNTHLLNLYYLNVSVNQKVDRYDKQKVYHPKAVSFLNYSTQNSYYSL